MGDSVPRKASPTFSYLSIKTQHEHESTASTAAAKLDTFLSRYILAILVVIGTFLGTVLGHTLRKAPFVDPAFWTPTRISYLFLPGEIFNNAITVLSIPIACSSVIAAIGSMDKLMIQYTIWRAFVLFNVLTIVASVTGAVAAILGNPGYPEDRPIPDICFTRYPANDPSYPYGEATCTEDNHPCYAKDYSNNWWDDDQYYRNKKRPMTPGQPTCGQTFIADSCELAEDYFLDLFRIFLPLELMDGFLHTYVTEVNIADPIDKAYKGYKDCSFWLARSTNETEGSRTLQDFYIHTKQKKAANIHGLITFSICLAVAAVLAGVSGRPVLNFFTSLSECTLIMGNWILWLSPIGVCSTLTAEILFAQTNFLRPPSIMHYALTSTLSMAFFGFVFLPFIYYVFIRKSPLGFFKQIIPVLLIAVGTRRTIAVVPLAIRILEDVAELDPRVVRLVIPIATMINFNGLAVLNIVSTYFIAQLHGINFDLGETMKIIFYNTVIVSHATVNDDTFIKEVLDDTLKAAKLPGEAHAYTQVYDLALDHQDTMTNVLSDCVAAAIIHHMCASHQELVRLAEIRAHMFDWNESRTQSKNSTSVDQDGKPKRKSSIVLDGDPVEPTFTLTRPKKKPQPIHKDGKDPHKPTPGTPFPGYSRGIPDRKFDLKQLTNPMPPLIGSHGWAKGIPDRKFNPPRDGLKPPTKDQRIPGKPHPPSIKRNNKQKPGSVGTIGSRLDGISFHSSISQAQGQDPLQQKSIESVSSDKNNDLPSSETSLAKSKAAGSKGSRTNRSSIRSGKSQRTTKKRK